MSVSIAKDSAAIKKDSSKLLKIFKAIKKFLAKEFLWVLFVLLVALPLGFAFSYIIKRYIYSNQNSLDTESIEVIFIASYAISVVGIYFTRFVIGAIKTLTSKLKKS